LNFDVGNSAGEWRAHACASQFELRFLHGDFGAIQAALGACGLLPFRADCMIGDAFVEKCGLAMLRFRRAQTRLRFRQRQPILGGIDRD
jgi:hypothetical protein